MPTLQRRDLPDDVYAAIASAARAEQRSLAQQAVVELRRALNLDLAPQRRCAVMAPPAARQQPPGPGRSHSSFASAASTASLNWPSCAAR